MSFRYFGKYGITFFYAVNSCKQHFVASIFKKRSHTVSAQRQRNGMPFIYHLDNFWHQYSIGYLLLAYFDIVL